MLRRALLVARRIGQFVSTQSFSSLTRRIVFLNVAGLLALVVSILYLSQFRAGLIDARVQSLLNFVGDDDVSFLTLEGDVNGDRRVNILDMQTVKINLAVATLGLEMMGLDKAWNLNAELSALAHTSQRREYKEHLDEAFKTGGLRSYIETRDAPFQPEPFGPRSRPRS